MTPFFNKGIGIIQTKRVIPNEGCRELEPGNTLMTVKSRALPSINEVAKLREGIRMMITQLRVQLCKSKHHSSMSASFEPVSDKGRFAKTYVEPMFHWWGANFRLLVTPCLGTVDVVNAQGERQTVVNGASHNYAGFYSATFESEELQRICLETLPVSSANAVPLLRDAVHEEMAKFLGAAFCCTTSTGYGANYVALPALVESTRTAVVIDKACHNSIFTGVFLGKCASIYKFEHDDMKALESILKSLVGTSADEIIVIVEGLYSMDGDVPALDILWRLKIEYGFILYCDEAHSFLSLGSTGMGCLQYWNETHTERSVPQDLIDIRTGTLSKSIGGIGGFIAGKSALEERIRRQINRVDASDNISIPSSTMVQTLFVLGQPRRISHNLQRLAAISRFCRDELARFGVYVYGDEAGTPILPVWAGRPSASARLSYAFRQKGLLASPVTTPAVPFWQSRVRVNLSADFTDYDVDHLVATIIEGAVSTGLCCRPKRNLVLRRFNSSKLARMRLDSESNDSESATTFDNICRLIHRSAATFEDDRGVGLLSSYPPPPLDEDMITAGHTSRALYGVGAGSARWISGTFPPHLAVEKLVAEVHGTESAMTYSDATIGLASTIAALARPVLGCRQHYILFPRRASRAVRDGLTLIPPKGKEAPKLLGYRDLEESPGLIQKLAVQGVCFTVYMEDLDSDILRDLAQQAGQCPLTVVLHRPDAPAKCVDLRKLVADVPDHCGRRSGVSKLQVLVYGSFYEVFGLPGGYVAGSEALIRELRYTSRGYMYTTSTAPFVMQMVHKALARSISKS